MLDRQPQRTANPGRSIEVLGPAPKTGFPFSHSTCFRPGSQFAVPRGFVYGAAETVSVLSVVEHQDPVSSQVVDLHLSSADDKTDCLLHQGQEGRLLLHHALWLAAQSLASRERMDA